MTLVSFLLTHLWLARFKYQDCINTANNNIEDAIVCVSSFKGDMKEGNAKMAVTFKKDYAAYM